MAREDANKPGEQNVCSRLFGERAGMGLDAWLSRNAAQLVMAYCVAHGISAVLWAVGSKRVRSVATAIAATVGTAFVVPWYLGLRRDILKMLLGRASVWFWLLSMSKWHSP